MMVGAYANLQGALLNLMEALVAAYIGKVSLRGQNTYIYIYKETNNNVVTRHEANKELLIIVFCGSRRCKFVRWP